MDLKKDEFDPVDYGGHIPGKGFYLHKGCCYQIWTPDFEDCLVFRIVGKNGLFVTVHASQGSSEAEVKRDTLYSRVLMEYFDNSLVSEVERFAFREDYKNRAIRGEINPISTWQVLTSIENLTKFDPSIDPTKVAA